MARILVHLTHGPEHPTRAALAFLVAKSAVTEGHEVSLFLAGDAVQLMREAVLDSLSGLGTGSLREHHDALVEAGCKFYLSGMSCKSRGVDLGGQGATAAGGRERSVELAMPEVLVGLALEHDHMFSY